MTAEPTDIPGVRPLGVSGGFGIVEPAGEPCEDCGERPGVPHVCIADGAQHRHGMTHVHVGHHTLLRWLCDPCYRSRWISAAQARETD